MDWFSALAMVALGISLAACAGLRAWLPLLITGGLVRAGWLHVGTSFEFIGTTPALIAFGIATVFEIVADKIPAVDHALDVFSTVARPAAGALLAASTFGALGGPFSNPVVAIALGIVVGAPTAMVPHIAKSGARVVSTGTTGGMANPLLSVAEDVATAVGVVLAFIMPLIMLLAVMALSFWVIRKLVRASAKNKLPSS